MKYGNNRCGKLMGGGSGSGFGVIVAAVVVHEVGAGFAEFEPVVDDDVAVCHGCDGAHFV